MLIARCELPKLQPPASIYEFDRREIEIGSSGVLWGADAWITCTQAFPHVDRGWPDKVFLTLTVEGDHHEFGDGEGLANRVYDSPVPPGSLFVVDPSVPHWLLDRDAAFGERPPQRWIGLQWEVPRADAARRAREIAGTIGAVWGADPQDARYITW